jgi:hypothetical protein
MSYQTKRSRRTRCLVPLAIAGLVATLVPLALVGTGSARDRRAAAIVPGSVAVSGDAYGTFARVGNTVRSGRSARLSIGDGGCTFAGQQLPIHKENFIGLVEIPSLASGTGVVRTTGDASETDGRVVVRMRAEVHDVSLLGGLITAEEVKAVSTTSFDGQRIRSNARGSAFVSLVVGGIAIDANVPPNTTIALAGIGEVTLNEQIETERGLTVNMIHVHVNQENVLGYPVGTDAIVSHAATAMVLHDPPVPAVLDGRAYGTTVRGRAQTPIVVELRSGPTAPIAVPCLGTNGSVRRKFVANVEVPSDGSVLDADTIETTARGVITASSATAETSATIEAVNVLGTIVQATGIRAAAHASFSGGDRTFSDEGSSFTSLSVSGHAEIGADVPPNTNVEIAGLGRLWLHRVIRTPSSIEVRMIELEVTVEGNAFGLKVGTRIRVAVASASVHPV